MTRTFLRHHSLTALAAGVLVCAFASSPVAAQSNQMSGRQIAPIGETMDKMMRIQRQHGAGNAKGLATKKSPQAAHRFSATPSDIALPNSGADQAE